MKIHVSGSNLVTTFADQMKPFCYFGNNCRDHFDGTLFRFPFRNDTTAAQSEISKCQAAKGEAIDLLITNFKNAIKKAPLFLRNVKRIEMYYEGEGDSDFPELLYFAEVSDRKKVAGEGRSESQFSGFHHMKTLANVYGMGGMTTQNEWTSISDFIAGSHANPIGKDAFYSKLLQTPESKLPKTQHVVTVAFCERKQPTKGTQRSKSETPLDLSALNVQKEGSVDEESFEVSPVGPAGQTSLALKQDEFISVVDEYLILTSLGGGRCQIMACNPKYRHMKLLPWGGVAAHLTRNGKPAPPCNGSAFCFLPMPAETGLPVHINGYFELSSNRRDIWWGDDMTGEGKIRCEWNSSLLNDVIAPLYVNLVLLAGRIIGPAQYSALFPIQSKNEVWKLIVKEFYHECERRGKFLVALYLFDCSVIQGFS